MIFPRISRGRLFWVCLLLLLWSGALAYWLSRPGRGDARLGTFVHAGPVVPVVFTSRSETASFASAAPEGAGFTEPGQRLWAASEGRLRILWPNGSVHELTWNKPLPDGDTLIDVMSPTVSLDGKRILFAGRRASGHGRFRLYEIGVNGRGLRQLTGSAEDTGCTTLPPLRFRADGGVLPDAERRATDFDDVDPVELNFADQRILFVSSRTPDLGRDHTRRSTTLWLRAADGTTSPVTGNRNNDRWPFLLSSRYIAFSLWSRNREVITADLTDIRPFTPGLACATNPTDAWLGAFVQIPGGHFGMLVKPEFPVWRPRPLFANRITFMTTLAQKPSTNPPLTVVQVPPGFLANAPSATPSTISLPQHEQGLIRWGPDQDDSGRPLWLATPSPCPPSHVLLAGAPLATGETVPATGAYGLYLAEDDWPKGDAPANASAIHLQLLFNDPELVDAEPVAVYPRKIALATQPPTGAGNRKSEQPGHLFATSLHAPTLMTDLPGQRTDAGQSPIFDGPPSETLDHLRIYAAQRDRFDDPRTPRILGTWEFIRRVPVQNGAAATKVPTEFPTVLAGFDKSGRVTQWTTQARDRNGRQATLYAYAGDHYSLAQPNGKHFCVGCHPGHSGFSADHHLHAELLD